MSRKGQTKSEVNDFDALLTNVAVDTDKVTTVLKPPTIAVKSRMEFLQAVVRGQGAETKRFKNWFPDLSSRNLRCLPKYARWRMESTVWKNPNVSPSTQPTDDRVIYVEMLRRQLRVIWHRAVAGNNPKAPVVRLRSEVREFQHLIRREKGDTEPGPDDAVWCQKTESALEWLEHNTHKLRLCGIVDCHHPYFIATPTRKKYCSTVCQEKAEVERSRERWKENQEKKNAAAHGGLINEGPRLSPEGRERIAKAAKARWARYQANKRRTKRN